MFFIAYDFKGQVHVFAGRVKIVSYLSCRTSTILKLFCSQGTYHIVTKITPLNAGPHSAVCNVSGSRCVSDCRSRGREFDPGPVHTFVEIFDHEMISTVILLPSADSFKKGCCKLQAKVSARITG